MTTYIVRRGGVQTTTANYIKYCMYCRRYSCTGNSLTRMSQQMCLVLLLLLTLPFLLLIQYMGKMPMGNRDNTHCHCVSAWLNLLSSKYCVMRWPLFMVPRMYKKEGVDTRKHPLKSTEVKLTISTRLAIELVWKLHPDVHVTTAQAFQC